MFTKILILTLATVSLAHADCRTMIDVQAAHYKEVVDAGRAKQIKYRDVFREVRGFLANSLADETLRRGLHGYGAGNVSGASVRKLIAKQVRNAGDKRKSRLDVSFDVNETLQSVVAKVCDKAHAVGCATVHLTRPGSFESSQQAISNEIGHEMLALLGGQELRDNPTLDGYLFKTLPADCQVDRKWYLAEQAEAREARLVQAPAVETAAAPPVNTAPVRQADDSEIPPGLR